MSLKNSNFVFLFHALDITDLGLSLTGLEFETLAFILAIVIRMLKQGQRTTVHLNHASKLDCFEHAFGFPLGRPFKAQLKQGLLICSTHIFASHAHSFKELLQLVSHPQSLMKSEVVQPKEAHSEVCKLCFVAVSPMAFANLMFVQIHKRSAGQRHLTRLSPS
jgi:hypothetical protein